MFKALEYKNINDVVTRFKINTSYISLYKYIRDTGQSVSLTNMQPHKKFINESGLYKVLSKSKKPLAELFMRKYFIEIMPLIRKTGVYIATKKDKLNIVNLNNKINETKNDNINLLNNQRNIIYPTGKAIYIIILKKIRNYIIKLVIHEI